jgi:hypothetical protein
MAAEVKQVIEPIPWDRAKGLLNSEYRLDDACAGLIAAATARAKKLGTKAIVYRARYSFGDHVICGRNSFALPARCTEPIVKLGLDGLVPVCLVLKNAFEAYLPFVDDSEHADVPRSLRLLRPGDLFGVFEAANRFCGIDHQKDEWCVSAGARTARLLFPLDDKQVLHHFLAELTPSGDATPPETLATLIRILREAIVHKQSGRHADRKAAYLEDWTWHLMVGLNHKLSSDWSAELMMFPPQWFDGQRRASTHAARCTDEGCEKLQVEVLKTAWLQAQDEVRRALRWQAISKAKEINTLLVVSSKNTPDGVPVQLLACMDDIASGRAVAHVCSKDMDSTAVEQAGPFASIIEYVESGVSNLRRGRQTMPVVVVPTYLRNGCSAYVSFSRPAAAIADLGIPRKSRFFRTVGDQIASAATHLEALIPNVEWATLKLFAQFQKEGKCHKKISTFAKEEGAGLHTDNNFFLQFARVKRRS